MRRLFRLLTLNMPWQGWQEARKVIARIEDVDRLRTLLFPRWVGM